MYDVRTNVQCTALQILEFRIPNSATNFRNAYGWLGRARYGSGSVAYAHFTYSVEMTVCDMVPDK